MNAFGLYVSFLKPGDHLIFTCTKDPVAGAGVDLVGGGCDGDPIGGTAPAMWDGPFQKVIEIFGKGDLYSLPPALRDRRFFFQQYTLAHTKYLKAFGLKGHAATLTDVDNVKIDLENTFWDISDINQFDKIEYVDRDYVDATHEPTNFEYGSDPKVANQRTTTWDRKMSRAERAMYQSLLGSSTLPLGKKDNVRFSNMFGTDVLSGAWYQGSVAWESVACATTGDDGKTPPCGGSALGPYNGSGDYHATKGLDSDGLPLLADYPGAWGRTIFAKGNSPIKITGYIRDVQTAKLELPQFTDEYDPTTAVVQTVSTMAFHNPKQPGVGVNVPLSGTRDKLIQSGELDFSGNTSTYRVKYDFQTCQQEGLAAAQQSKACNLASQQSYLCAAGLAPTSAPEGNDVKLDVDPTCHKSTAKRDDGQDNYCCDGVTRPQFVPTNVIKILAIDSQDFLGDVFMCADPRTGDILRVRMYDSAQSVLDWLTNHPGTTQACDIVVRWSPFNNYLDKIFSRTYGVTLDISKSFGAGRVDDAMLWDASLLSQ
jgi:hypothetical protein